MRRVYNRKICFIAVAIVVIVALGVLFGTSIQVFARDNGAPTLHKYYTSICIEEGDTLWDIAGEYVQNIGMSRQAYIDEVCKLNGICADEIYAGDYIVVMYYGVE